MKLLLGMSGLTLSAILFALLLIGVRNPKPARWKADGLVTNVYAPGIIGMGIMGVGFMVRWAFSVDTVAVNWGEIGSAAAVALAGVILLKLLQIKKRLARYEQLEAGRRAEVIPLSPPEKKPEPPVVDRRAA